MKHLRIKYEEDGKFPACEIKQVENKLDEAGDYVYFVSSESVFYIPDRTLTEEELLEIIDLQEKRDYSVRSQNSLTYEEKTGDSPTDNSGAIEKNYLTKVAEIYNLDSGKLSIKSENVRDGFTESIIAGYGVEYMVYYSESDGLYRIMLSKEDVPAHSFVNKIREKDINMIKKCISDKVPLFTNRQIEMMEMYYMADKNYGMVSGTISVYCYMTDGTGCVAVYSMAYNDIYDIYVLHDTDEIRDMIKQKKKSAYKSEKQYVKI